MKKHFVLCAVVTAMIAVPNQAWSSEHAAPGQVEHPMEMMQRPNDGPGGTPDQEGAMRRDPREEAEHFQEYKAELLTHINAHLAEVQQHRACVQDANDPQALHACKPPRRPHDGPPGSMHEGMPRGAMGGHNPAEPDAWRSQHTPDR